MSVYTFVLFFFVCIVFFFQAEDGIRDLVRSRGLGDVYKRQPGARPIAMKVLFRKSDGRFLGAQAVGEDGVDKRILSLIHI